MPEDMVGRKETYVLQCQGRLDDRRADPRRRLRDRREPQEPSGTAEMVIALLDGDSATLKKLYREGGGQGAPAARQRAHGAPSSSTADPRPGWSSSAYCAGTDRESPSPFRAVGRLFVLADSSGGRLSSPRSLGSISLHDPARPPRALGAPASPRRLGSKLASDPSSARPRRRMEEKDKKSVNFTIVPETTDHAARLQQLLLDPELAVRLHAHLLRDAADRGTRGPGGPDPPTSSRRRCARGWWCPSR